MKRAAADARVARVAFAVAFFENGDLHAFVGETQRTRKAGEAAADDEGFKAGCGGHG